MQNHNPDFIKVFHTTVPNNTQNTTISIVIPCYNRSGIISTCLQSLTQQTYQDFEVIIIDDASDDSEQLLEQLEKFPQLNIRYIRHEKNKHGAAARNTGILAAKGEFIALLDSDDSWAANKLELCLQHCSQYNDVIYSQLKSHKGSVHPKRAKKENELVGDYLIINNGCMQTSTLFLHQTFAQHVLFDHSLKRFQDYDFTLRLEAADANFIFIPKILTFMHEDQGGTRISAQVDSKPAIFWLNQAKGLSIQARKAFYLKRTVKLLIKSGEQRKIFKFMPEDIHKKLTFAERLYCHAMAFFPYTAYKQLQKIRNHLA